MTMHIRPVLKGAALMALGAVLLPASWSARATPPSPAPIPSSTASVPGWTDFLDGLRGLPDAILARLPVEQRNDPQIRQEVGRLALSAVAAASIDALAADPNHPVFIPQISNYITTGQPNADTNYRSAKIAPGGTYRLRGRRGSMNLVRIAEGGPRPKQVAGQVNLGGIRPVHDLNALPVDAEGRYNVILSPTKPEGYKGDWWQLDPSSTMLLVRMVGSEWGKEIEPTLSIERLDIPAPRPRPSAAVLEEKLRSIPVSAGFIAPLLVDRVEKLRADGIVNSLRGADMTQLGGLKGQFYYEGAYALKDDEALIVEAPLPERCGYRSLILTNDIYETTDWYNNHSSLNAAQAPADKDGILRIIVSARDPGVPNWLDTAGFATGAIQGRWTDCSSQPVPTVRKVKVADVRKSLPKDTPTITAQERDRLLRDRRAALQQRPLW
ncbi:hypothetical protein LWE61_07305 [Sphingobium sufflavum]|uniref:hypothetical protein n=1 Tax=Sphingobium sufflavum TaxID=1129547 RepID=UPI001F27EC10|nr:hypothetical protein [Sphingobium sufflavum]MCE7796367.1 hypothetical protein [Sphingobium sufflavum]